MLKLKITEDTITEYMDFIWNSFNKNAPRELKKQARLLTGEEGDEGDGYIAPNMTVSKFGEFNPNLFMSGQEEEFWKLYSNSNPYGLMGVKDTHSIEIIYTGMRLNRNYGDDAKVWSEFGDKAAGRLERDYAYFQETGLDPIAKPKQARAKGAIATGVRESKTELLQHSSKYLESILKKQNGDIPPKLI